MDMNQQTQEGLSRKERREMKREEVRSEQARAARGRGAKRLLTWFIVAAVLGGIGWFVWNAAQNAPGTSTADGTLSVAVSESDNMKGDPEAPITLVEYGDYQCPACGAFHSIVEQLFEQNEGQIRLVFRHFPLNNIHPNADTAARAVQAAGLQGKYWEMHNVVFERQQEWSPLPRGSVKNRMLEYAMELGMNAEQLDADMDSDAVEDKIAADIDSGEASGVNSTPSFYVNGERISDFASLEDFQAKVLRGALEPSEPSMNTHDEGANMGEAL